MTTALRPSSDVSPNAPSSMWKANGTSHAPCVGVEVIGGFVEKRHGQTTSQLQFSK